LLGRERLVSPPDVTTVWAGAKPKITQLEIDRLLDGGIVQIGWTPPISLLAKQETPELAVDLMCATYDFRLEFAKDGAWYVDGKGPGMNGWLPVEGPMWGPSPSDRAIHKLGMLLLAICSPEGSA
jgi:hypothetical protein